LNFSCKSLGYVKKSIDESYDEMKKKQRQLEYYIDDGNFEEYRNVSRPSWRTIREIQQYEKRRPDQVNFLNNWYLY